MMPSLAFRQWVNKCAAALRRPRFGSPRPRRGPARPQVERLEDRLVPTLVAPGNYGGNLVGTTEFYSTTGTYVINANATVPSGSSLIVDQGVTVQINYGATLTISNGGSLSVSYATVSLADNPSAEGISVAGTMTTYGSRYSVSGMDYGNTTSSISVAAGGHLTAYNNTFGWKQFTLAQGSTLNSGDITSNTFLNTVSVPIQDVPLLANNVSFNAVDILAGTLGGNQTVTLSPLGTNQALVGNQSYVFAGNLTVASGSTLAVGPNTNGVNANVLLDPNVTVTVNSGATLTVNSAASFATLASGSSEGITVNGTMSVTNTSFTISGTNYSYNTSFISVGASGHLTATNSTFGWSQLNLATGSTLASGDLTGDTFNTTLSLPLLDVPLVANNVSFQDVDITGGTLGSGQSENLSPLGTNQALAASQRYVFTGNVTVASSATLTFGSGANVLIDSSNAAVLLTVSGGGTLNATNATFAAKQGPGVSEGIAVYGTMSVTNSTFSLPGTQGFAYPLGVTVGTGGHLTASGNTFGWNLFSLAGDSVLNAGDLTGNTFATTVTVPLFDVPLLTNNLSFQAVDILAGTLGSGQTVALNPLGTNAALAANQSYVFASNVTIGSGSMVTVGAGANVLLNGTSAAVTLTVAAGGTLEIDAPATFESSEGLPGQTIAVSGTLNLTGTRFTDSPAGYNYNTSSVVVNSGGTLNAVSSSFGWKLLTLGAGSTDTLHTVAVAGQLTVDSSATLAVTGNNFTNTTVVATGSSTATIDLSHNYWGTTGDAQIRTRITDHATNSNLPAVVIDPVLGGVPGALNLSSTAVGAGQASGTPVGTFTTTEIGAAGTFTYALVGGNGSTDNGTFAVSNGQLVTAGPLTAGATYSVRVRSTDQNGSYYEEVFAITATGPTGVSLSNSSVGASQPANTVVGILSSTDVNLNDTFTYTLVGGAGSADNASFNVSGNQLRTTASLTAGTAYSVRVRATDEYGAFAENTFAVNATGPTAVTLSNNSVAGNQPVGTAVGTLGSTDANMSDTFTYTLVGGAGSADNASFKITNGKLVTNTSLSAAAQSVYSVRVRSTNENGAFAETALTVLVTGPTAVTLSNTTLAEGQSSGTVVGNLGATDANMSDTLTYALVGGAGSTGNGSFRISNGRLLTNAVFNAASQSSYNVRVRATNQDGSYVENTFTVLVSGPTGVSLSSASTPGSQPAGTVVGTLSTADAVSGETFTYTLVSGSGSTNNASFAVNNVNQLVTATPLAAGTRYGVRVRSTDENGNYTEQAFTVTASGPSALALSNSSVGPGQPAGTVVGTLSSTDANANDTFTYTLVPGVGSTNNAYFNINNGNQLVTSAPLAAGTQYGVRVRTTDENGVIFEMAFTVTAAGPTGLSLSNSSVSGSRPAGTTVGVLSSTDANANDTFVYTLVSGAGSTGNASFAVSGNQLVTAAPLAAGSSYSVRVRTTNQAGQYFEQAFTVSVTGPTAVTLSGSTVPGSQPAGTAVGTLGATDANANDTLTYTLVSGAGSTGNGSFSISGNQLVTAGPLASGVTYGVRVRVTNQYGAYAENTFSVTVTGPTAVTLSNNTVPEGRAAGTAVGTLGATDANANDTLTYTLVSGAGSADNASFTVSNGQLLTAASFNAATKSSYAVRVRATNGNGSYVEMAFTVLVGGPTGVSLTSASAPGSQAAGTVVGTLSSADAVSADTFTYALVTGVGSGNNASFSVSGNQLVTTGPLTPGATYAVRVRSTDENGNSAEMAFTITATGPTAVTLSNTSFAPGQSAGTVVGNLGATDANGGDRLTYTLVSGTGSTDNASFTVNGSQLVTAASLSSGTYAVRVRATNQNGSYAEMMFTVAASGPTAVSLSNATVLAFRPTGTVVGNLSSTDANANDTFTYTLVSGAGSADNASFSISGNQLVSADAFNAATKSSYSVRVRSTSQGGQTFEQTFTITVVADPALSLSGRTLTVTGTSGNDTFGFTPGVVRDSLTRDGVALAVDTASVDTVAFQGGVGGADRADLNAGSNAATASLTPAGGTLTGVGYAVTLSGVATIVVNGTSADTGYLYGGGSGTDTLVGTPASASLSGAGYVSQVSGFGVVSAYSQGGTDTAYLSGGPGSNAFVGTPTYAYLNGAGFFDQANGFKTVVATATGGDAAYLYGAAGGGTFVGAPTYSYLGGSGFFNQVNGFKSVLGNSAGGSDAAYLYGGAGNDSLVAMPTYSALSGAGYYEQANGFRTVTAYSNGGSDSAYLYGSAGADTFVGTPTYASLAGAGYYNQANGFSSVVGFSNGGADAAYLSGGAGTNTFVGAPSYSYLSGAGFFNQVQGFKTVVGTATGAADAAYLSAGPGSNTFVGTPTYAYLSGTGFFNQANGFKSVVGTSAGGTDTAYLYDSAGADTFVGTPGYAYLSGTGFFNQATGFKTVVANSSGGGDTAYLYDSAGADTFVATPAYAYLSGTGFFNQVNGFKTVSAFSSGGGDTAYLYDGPGSDNFVGTPTYSYLSGAGFFNQANGFKTVVAYSTGGSDTADLFDSPGNDTFQGSGSSGTLTGPGGYLLEELAFALVRIHSTQGGSDHASVSALNYIFQEIGPWN